MGQFFKTSEMQNLKDFTKNIDWKAIGKKYVLPSILIGTGVGAITTAATSDSKKDFKRHAIKGITTGILADAVTGLGLAVWNKELKKVKI